jgi:hypothetical protein
LLDCSEFGNFVITFTYLFVEAHIMDDDDTALDGGADVGPVNLWMHSLFSDVSVSLDENMVSPPK